MAVTNNFKIIGRCYGDASLYRTKEDNLRVEFILLTNDSFKRKNVNYIPCMCYKDIAQQATAFCRDNNVVAVEGEICSYEMIDKVKGTRYKKIVLIVTSMMLIYKAKKKWLSERKFTDIVDMYQPDEFMEISKESSEDDESN